MLRAKRVVALPAQSRRLSASSGSIAVLALLCAISPASAWAARHSGAGGLSARLAELARPAVSSAPRAAQAEALSLPASGPGSLLREGNRVLVEVRFDQGAAAAGDGLRAAGAEVVDVSPRYQTVTVAAKPAQLRKLATVPGVAGAMPVLAPIVASTCPSGKVVSEGDLQLHAKEAREAPTTPDGAGVTVGILSDSFDTATKSANGAEPIETKAADDVETGDLPGAANTCAGQATLVDVVEDYEPTEPEEPEPADEGRGMAQIVHDLAPGAKLAFATAFTGEPAFAENIEKLAAPGPGGAEAGVIVDDVSYFGEPFFQEGPVAVAVQGVTDDGVSYFSSAGNNNLIDAAGDDIASWEAPAFRDAACPSGMPFYANECMDFHPGSGVDPTFGIRVSPGATLMVDLQWAQPWNGVTTDLDAYLLNSSDEVVANSEEFNVASTQRPFEFVPWKNTSAEPQTVRLAINRCSSSCDPVNGGDASSPRLKIALLQNGGGVTETEYPRSIGGDTVGPTVFGHNGARAAISTGAIRFNETEAPERYSSRGPVSHYFGPVNGVTPAAPLPEAEVLSKPDVTASDCVATTFFASFVSKEATWRFCGTSAAAPHAAAVAALMLEEKPAAEPDEVRTALQESAAPIGGFGTCAIGAGLVEAVGAIEALLTPGSNPSTPCKALESEPIVESGGTVSVFIPPEEPQPQPAPPQTRFLKHPPKIVRTKGKSAIVTFRFAADESGVTFLCRVDEGARHRCASPLRRRFGLGSHAVRVFARNAAGAVDPTPAAFRFRVKRIG